MSTTPRRQRGLPRTFVAVAVLLGILAGAYGALSVLAVSTRATEHTTRTYPATGELRINAGSGDVTVLAERRSDVAVTSTVTHGMWRPRIAQRLHDGRVELTSGCTFWASLGIDSCDVSFVVHVPSHTHVIVDASSGDVHLRGIRGAVQVQASAGDILAEGVAGPLTLDASSGDLHVERYLGRRLDAQASSGDVVVEAVRAPQRLTVDASSGDVSLRVPDAVYRVETDTSSGDEHVAVRQSPDATRLIKVRASSGDVSIARLDGAR